ncbi:MAG: hypothetical protein QXH73_02735 [Ignisphaera sp.]
MSRSTSVNGKWVCECIICRVFIYPILKIKEKKSSKEEVKSEEIEELSSPESVEIETEKASSSIPSINLEKLSESIVSQLSSTIESKLGNINQRIDMIENEVKNVQENFAKSLDDVRNALVDVRAALAEFMNPFNVLKSSTTIQNKSDRSEIKKEFLSLFEKLLYRGGNSIVTDVGEQAKGSTAVSKDTDVTNIAEAVSSLGIEFSKGVKRLGLGGIIKLMKWIDDMIDRVPRDVIEELSKFIANIGIITEEEKNILIAIIDFVYNARKIGVKVNEQIVYIYTLAKIFGISDSEADAEILKMAMNNDKIGSPLT